MKRALEAVTEFHRTYGHPVAERPTLPGKKLFELRERLIAEELAELGEAYAKADVVGIADALGDLAYVVAGAAVAFGIPLDRVFEEIHRSNMSKLGADGKPIYREDGKVMKGPNYFPPDIEAALVEAPQEANQH